ncbi:hypothetical protein DPMN_038959 [Dreissena polymorpha]|uniref:Uncharacterized protein n=1 Tax=Dreissena polymorpha TaxID=45954 RepID=A0A9D4RR68_DREPO|nr:hypothetical protein DPMN_038959 [Dreissena polymorpha]
MLILLFGCSCRKRFNWDHNILRASTISRGKSLLMWKCVPRSFLAFDRMNSVSRKSKQ